ncbi:hypothetical protein FHX09_005754 [Rhizobium sp. BK538]|nr:hypothetical protein [Rhizobium sp. BK060]MBB4171857.1 hypothetical protein [Rhizobium sp. BK538]TCM75943.1 hypothetical protein EV291_11142 [Rhizobium sp. BK068]
MLSCSPICSRSSTPARKKIEGGAGRWSVLPLSDQYSYLWNFPSAVQRSLARIATTLIVSIPLIIPRCWGCCKRLKGSFGVVDFHVEDASHAVRLETDRPRFRECGAATDTKFYGPRILFMVARCIERGVRRFENATTLFMNPAIADAFPCDSARLSFARTPLLLSLVSLEYDCKLRLHRSRQRVARAAT